MTISQIEKELVGQSETEMATTALESAKGSTETDNKNAQSSTSTAGTASKPKSTDQAGDLEGLESWSEEDENAFGGGPKRKSSHQTMTATAMTA